MMTLVVHVHDPRFRDNPGAVYIGRAARRATDPRCRVASVWENPYTVKGAMGRAHAIAAYETMWRTRLKHGWVREQNGEHEHVSPDETRALLLELRGKVLGCWCKPKACHGDVLVKLIEEYGA